MLDNEAHFGKLVQDYTIKGLLLLLPSASISGPSPPSKNLIPAILELKAMPTPQLALFADAATIPLKKI